MSSLQAGAQTTQTSEQPLASVGILGDSLATGAGANPQLVFQADLLWDFFKGQKQIAYQAGPAFAPYLHGEPLGSPVSLWQMSREYHGSLDWVYLHAASLFSKLYLDSAPYSWGYLSGRALGAKSQAIYIAAQDGARMAALARQTDRLLNHLDGQLPASVFIHFSGNDLCANRMVETTSAPDFGKELQRGLQYLVRNASPAPGGSTVYVVGFLGITQVLTNPSILQKPVEAHGEMTTCQELRERAFQPRQAPSSTRHPESLYFQQFVPPNPAAICPTLFAQSFLARSEQGIFASFDKQQRERKIKADTEEMVSVLAGRIRSYRAKSAAVVKAVSEWARLHFPEKRLQLVYLPETEWLRFEGDDIGPDCFHLSLAGQMKVANAVISGVRAQSAAKAAPPAKATP